MTDGIFLENLLIYFDKQAPIRSLSKVLATFIFVYECRDFIEITDHSKVTLSSVPVHKDIVGNCIADELPRARTELATSGTLQSIGILIASVEHSLVFLRSVTMSDRGYMENCQTLSKSKFR